MKPIKCSKCGTGFIAPIEDDRFKMVEYDDDVPWLCSQCGRQRGDHAK